MITKEQLKRVYPHHGLVDKFYDELISQMKAAEISTAIRQSAFLAQIGHESGCLYYTEEIASGGAYEGRRDLGNIEKGDGVRFKGRGLIQVTGRANYTEISKDLGVDFISNPKLLSTPSYAVASAIWYWNKRKLNQIADSQDFRLLTKKINGGYNGYKHRLDLYNKFLDILM